ncbi:MAG: tail fiber assembly protein [Rhodospirillaceae bacterium]
MVKHAIVRDGVVVNVIAYDSTPVGVVPGFDEEHMAVPIEGAGWALPVSVGWVFANGHFTDPHAPTESEREALAWVALRQQRGALLTASDWTQLQDVPSTVNQGAWRVYRQALRDLPATVVDPANPTWPDAPQ